MMRRMRRTRRMGKRVVIARLWVLREHREQEL
jgi:hypothetical protein